MALDPRYITATDSIKNVFLNILELPMHALRYVAGKRFRDYICYTIALEIFRLYGNGQHRNASVRRFFLYSLIGFFCIFRNNYFAFLVFQYIDRSLFRMFSPIFSLSRLAYVYCATIFYGALCFCRDLLLSQPHDNLYNRGTVL